MTNTRFRTGFSALAAALIAPTALAQNAFRPLPELPELHGEAAGGAGAGPRARTEFDVLDEEAALPRTNSFIEVRAFASGAAGSSLQGGGEVATQSGGWAATFGTEVDGERLSALCVRAEADFYDLSGATTLVPGENQPFNDLYRASLSGMTRTVPGASPGMFAGFMLALGGEDNASTQDSMIVGGAGGLRFERGRDFALELGLAAQSRLEDDLWLWPYIGLRWQANDWLDFEARGTSLEARAALDEHWSLFGRAEYTLRQFRLNSDNPLPSGVVRDEEIRGGLGLARRGDDGFEFELLGGLELWRELSTLDRDGTHVSEDEIDPTPFVALSLTLSF